MIKLVRIKVDPSCNWRYCPRGYHWLVILIQGSMNKKHVSVNVNKRVTKILMNQLASEYIVSERICVSLLRKNQCLGKCLQAQNNKHLSTKYLLAIVGRLFSTSV